MSAASPVRRHRSGLFGLLALGTLAACSSVPDWANPVAWYDGMFGDEVSPSNTTPQSQSTSEGRQRLEEAQQTPAPRVGSVPERPRATSREERNSVAAGLAADREAARYTDEELRGRPASSSNLAPAPPPPAVAAAPPAPAGTAAAPGRPPAAPTATAPAPAPVPGQTTAPPAPAVATAPIGPSPGTAPPQAAAPSPVAAAPVAPTPPPPTYAATARPVATLPPPPTGGYVAPIRDTQVLESTYIAALSQSAATVTTAPANAAFVTSRPAGLQRPATTVPPNVLEAYHASAPAAAYLPPTPAPAIAPQAGPARLASYAAGGLPPVNQNVPFDRAGSRLVGTVEFASGGAGLDRRDREIVSSALAQHNTRGGTIRVVGYAPRSAGAVGAFRLSQDRANAVARELVREGANQQYVFVEAHGSAGNGAANRVEVYLEN